MAAIKTIKNSSLSSIDMENSVDINEIIKDIKKNNNMMTTMNQ